MKRFKIFLLISIFCASTIGCSTTSQYVKKDQLDLEISQVKTRIGWAEDRFESFRLALSEVLKNMQADIENLKKQCQAGGSK